VTTESYKSIIINGLWKNNTSFVQLLGLCPLLAVSNTVVNAIGLGIATILVLIITNALISVLRNYIPHEIRLPIFVLLIACSVSAVEFFIKAYYYDLYMVLGIFIPLIVTNCFVIGRAEAFAVKNPVGHSIVDAISIGLGFTLAISCLAGIRETVGQGTLFANANIMFGESAKFLTLTVFENYRGFLLAILPPGAFLVLGLLIAGKNWIEYRTKKNVKIISIQPIEKTT
jgi:Na+-translocating ferredoxin:NAD+ oxidoreductase subunit E